MTSLEDTLVEEEIDWIRKESARRMADRVDLVEQLQADNEMLEARNKQLEEEVQDLRERLRRTPWIC